MSVGWYSASLSYLVTVQGAHVKKMMSVVVLKAPEGQWEAAKGRAVSLGRKQERAYLNSEGEKVEWRLAAVSTLDYLGPELQDGREVYAEPREVTDRDKMVKQGDLPEPGSSGV